ncbi:hypothetical protein AHiyo8_02230 [Arthrobacter sp. Hiyo8]|nr:hypothetical protein AHiyo8_02230 [Arthrobacter sp. Hiyo8]
MAPNAAFFATLLLFLNWLKSFFFALLAKALTLLQMFLAWAASIGGAVWNFFTAPFQAAGAAVANAIAFVTGGAAISTSVAAAGVAASRASPSSGSWRHHRHLQRQRGSE